ncbi:MAG: restriction endonuclease subunit S [Betaproteobacteria bacterium]|nr:restriction endonuclease subunit S [Betaproteobacteria bacterium]
MSDKNKQILKPGWRRVKFGDVVRLSKARSQEPLTDGFDRYVGLEHLEPGDLRIRRWGNVADGVTFTSVFQPGQVLFGKRRAYQRKVAVADFAGVCSGDIYVLETKDALVLLPELLPFICQTDAFFDHAVGTSAGSLSPRTNWTSLAGFEFALPAMKEQRRTLALLSAGLSTVDELRSAIDALPILRRSMETRLLSMDGVPKQKVGDIAKFTSGRGIRVSDLPKAPSDMNPVPVHGGNGISGYTDIVMDGTSEPTVVIGRVGQFCGVTSMTAGPCWITDNALYPAKMSPDIQPEFLAICLRASNLNRSKLGEYLPLITQEVVHKIEIPVPALSDQSVAITEFAQIGVAETSLMSRLSSTRSLVMQVAIQMVEGSSDGI